MRSKRWFLLAGTAAVVTLAASWAWHDKAGAEGTLSGHGERTGMIATIDVEGKTFDCHWQTNDWSYTTTGETAFFIDKKEATFADLDIGQTVRVAYHVVGKNWVADKVVITPQ
jgi:hypothetical protein